MIRQLFSTLILLCSFSLVAQTGLVSGELNVTTIPTNNGNGTFTIVGNFSDSKGRYFASDVEANMSVWKGNNYFFIQSASANGSELTLTVADSYSIGFLPTGIYSVGQETPTLKLPGISTTGDSNPALQTPPDQASKWNHILWLIDSAYANINTVYTGSGTVPEGGSRVAPSSNDGIPFLFDYEMPAAGFPADIYYTGIFDTTRAITGDTLVFRMGAGIVEPFGYGGEGFPALSVKNLNDGTENGLSINPINDIVSIQHIKPAGQGSNSFSAKSNGLEIRAESFLVNNGITSTIYPVARPSTENSFWQYNTDGTGEYVEASSIGGGILANNGLSLRNAQTEVVLGGPLDQFTQIDQTTHELEFTTNSGAFSLENTGANFLYSDGAGQIEVDIDFNSIFDVNAVSASGRSEVVAGGGQSRLSFDLFVPGTYAYVWANDQGLELTGQSNLFINTPQVFSGGATAGQVLTLADANTGRVEFQDTNSENIYNTSSSLTDNRIVDLDGKNLTMVDTVFGSWGGLNLDVVPNQYVELFWNRSGTDYNAFRAEGKGLTLLGPNGIEIQTEDFGLATTGEVLTLQSDGTVEYEEVTTNRVAYLNFQDYTNDLATSSGTAKVGATSTLTGARGVKGPINASFAWTDIVNGDATSLTYEGPSTIANGSTVVTIEVTMYVRSIQAAPDGNNTLDLYVYKNGSKAINQGQRRISNIDEGYFEITLRYVDIGASTNDKYELYWEWAGWNAGNDTFVADGTWTATAK